MRAQSGGVLIVGAGPTGLTLAVELQRRGVPHRLIDRAPELHGQSRATDIQARTLELFHNIGVLDEVLAAGVSRKAGTIYANGRTLVRIEYADADTPFNFALGLVQHETQRILSSHHEQLGGQLEWGVRLTQLRQRGDCVTATLLDANGDLQEQDFDYVIGCDGVHSVVRRSLGIPFEGSTFEEDFFIVDVELESELPNDEITIVATAAGMAIVLPIGANGLMRVLGDLDPGFEDELDDATCTKLLRARLGEDLRIINYGWRSEFRINTRMVAEYRRDRVLLCGDAAHVHSPVTGHGMNCGIQDAYNLGWKLALVMQGHARAELLDSYHAERVPIARALLAETDIQTTVLMSRNRTIHGALVAVGQLAFSLSPLHRRFLASSIELSVSYPGSPIVSERRGSLLGSRLTPSSDSEQASVSDHYVFSAGPGPGERAPDHALGERSLFEIMRGVEHNLLLFDGRAPTEEGYENLADIAERVEQRWPGLIRPHVVVPRTDTPPTLRWTKSMIFDEDQSLHRRYGSLSESAYLIRPDGYVGFRSQPAQFSGIEDYMVRLLGQAN